MRLHPDFVVADCAERIRWLLALLHGPTYSGISVAIPLQDVVLTLPIEICLEFCRVEPRKDDYEYSKVSQSRCLGLHRYLAMSRNSARQ